jgi:lipoprotein-anchoring transpeptidase ErfK/SrfK
MGRHPLSPSRHGATLVAIVLLAGWAPSGCGVARPSPGHRPEQPGTPAPGVAPASEAGPRREAANGPKAHLVLRLGERRLYLMDDDPGTPVESFPVAIGKGGWETPTGRFQVEEMIEDPDFVKLDDTVVPARVIKRFPPGPLNPLGKRWIQFAHGEGWTLGIHGTPNPELLGRAVSHGCVRMRNGDVVRVYDRIHIGTTVVVEH